MAASIGKASLILNATYGQLTSGLDKAYASIGSWKSSVTKVFAGGVAGAIGGKLFSDALDSAKNLADMGRQAKAAGSGTAEFMALGKAFEKAQLNSEDLTQSLGKLETMIGRASVGSQNEARLFTRLGIEAKQLANLRSDEAFLQIAEAIHKIESPAQKAAAATDMFGEKGVKLMSVLDKGSDALKQYIAEQKDLGTALSDADIAKIQAVKEAWPKVAAAFEGAWNKIVVAMSPILTTIGDIVGKVFKTFKPLIDGFTTAISTVFEVISAVLGDEIVPRILEVVEGIKEWAAQLFGIDTATLNIRDVVIEMIRYIAKFGTYLYEALRVTAGVGASLGASVAKGIAFAIEKLGELVTYLKDYIPDWLGGGLAGDAEAAAKAMADRIRAGADVAAEWGNKQRNAFDGIEQDLAKVDQWFDRLLNKKDELAKPTRPAFVPPEEKTSLGAALLAGSREEYSVRVKFDTGIQGNLAAQQVAEQKKGNQIAESSNAKLAAIAGKKPQVLDVKR